MIRFIIKKVTVDNGAKIESLFTKEISCPELQKLIEGNWCATGKNGRLYEYFEISGYEITSMIFEDKVGND